MTCADDEYTIEWLQIRFSPRGRLWAGGRGNQKTGELRINQSLHLSTVCTVLFAVAIKRKNTNLLRGWANTRIQSLIFESPKILS